MSVNVFIGIAFILIALLLVILITLVTRIYGLLLVQVQALSSILGALAEELQEELQEEEIRNE